MKINLLIAIAIIMLILGFGDKYAQATMYSATYYAYSSNGPYVPLGVFGTNVVNISQWLPTNGAEKLDNVVIDINNFAMTEVTGWNDDLNNSFDYSLKSIVHYNYILPYISFFSDLVDSQHDIHLEAGGGFSSTYFYENSFSYTVDPSFFSYYLGGGSIPFTVAAYCSPEANVAGGATFLNVDNWGGSKIDVTYITSEYVAVPEPSTFLLLGAGLCGLVMLQRKRLHWQENSKSTELSPKRRLRGSDTVVDSSSQLATYCISEQVLQLFQYRLCLHHDL